MADLTYELLMKITDPAGTVKYDTTYSRDVEFLGDTYSPTTNIESTSEFPVEEDLAAGEFSIAFTGRQANWKTRSIYRAKIEVWKVYYDDNGNLDISNNKKKFTGQGESWFLTEDFHTVITFHNTFARIDLITPKLLTKDYWRGQHPNDSTMDFIGVQISYRWHDTLL